MSRWSIDQVKSRVNGFQLGPVSFTLPPGTAVAVLGPSGAGKTTLLRTLAGFLPIRAGRLLRDGIDISTSLPEERRLGYVPQGLGLFPHRTVEGNIRYPMDLRRQENAGNRTRELLERFHLTALSHRYPSRLSGGELQRVTIARALAADPQLIVWDEPWHALDVTARHELGLVLLELREVDRIPVVIVTHDPALAFSVADTFVVLHEGKVRFQGQSHVFLDAPSDRFIARFVGFENVLDRTMLESLPPTSLVRWLLDHSGPDGVAFASPVLAKDLAEGTVWEGVVRSAHPGPWGATLEVRVDGLSLRLHLPRRSTDRVPVLGECIAITLDPSDVHPLESPSNSLEAR